MLVNTRIVTDILFQQIYTTKAIEYNIFLQTTKAHTLIHSSNIKVNTLNSLPLLFSIFGHQNDISLTQINLNLELTSAYSRASFLSLTLQNLKIVQSAFNFTGTSENISSLVDVLDSKAIINQVKLNINLAGKYVSGLVMTLKPEATMTVSNLKMFGVITADVLAALITMSQSSGADIQGTICVQILGSSCSSCLQFSMATCCITNALIISQNNYYTCECPYGSIVNEQSSACICPIGAIISNNICKCPNFSQLIQVNSIYICQCNTNMILSDGKCICIPHASQVDSICMCPENSINDKQTCVCQPKWSNMINDVCACSQLGAQIINGQCQCFKGAEIDSNGICQCTTPGTTLQHNSCMCTSDYSQSWLPQGNFWCQNTQLCCTLCMAKTGDERYGCSDDYYHSCEYDSNNESILK
ncbi:Conserved_hypothetical protein [Hexamita inflata]|uniref:Transmembrane protein n=1 Tax=Hexamita inflata TaxID=28002 RepID=A0ABP1GL04_9EUKA